MKVFSPKYGLFCLFLGLFLSLLPSLSSADEGKQLRPQRVNRYQYRGSAYDLEPIFSDGRRGDGKYDTFLYDSYDGKPITRLYDFNSDGEIDTIQEWIRIENLEIEFRDRNFDKKADLLICTYPERQYVFIDTNDDGIFDRLAIKKCQIKTAVCEDGSEQTYQTYEKVLNINISHVVPVSSSLPLVKNLLFKTLSNEEADYVSRASTEKRRELQILLRNKEWEKLLQKTLEYLDFPSDLSIKLMIVDKESMAKGEYQQTIASIRFPSLFYICPELIDDRLHVWLELVDHEMLHVLQNRKIFYHCRRNGTSWQACADLVYHQRKRDPKVSLEEKIEGDHRIVKDIKSALTFRVQNLLYTELEAYLYQQKRVVLYDPPNLEQAIFEKSLLAHVYRDLILENGLPNSPLFEHLLEDAKRLLPLHPVVAGQIPPDVYLQLKFDTAKTHFPIVKIRVNQAK